MRDLHREVRVVYRACRRKYGTEKTQDECLRVFKAVFPCQYRAVEGMNRLSDKCIEEIRRIIAEWNPSGRLAELTARVDLEREMAKEEFVEFCQDITPVAMRIRKLTPRECLRLMNVDDKDIQKMINSGLSNSSLYKLAGNSIVVDVLYHIFRKAFVDKLPDLKKGESVQLSLF